MSKHKDIKAETKTERLSLLDVLFVRLAAKQICAYKKEAITAFIALLIFSLATLLVTTKTELFLGGTLDLDTLSEASHSVIPLVATSVLLAVAVVVLIWALFSIARPLKKRIVTLRLTLLAAALLLISIVKSLALGFLARALFAGDPTRFELAKTGVDNISAVLAILLAAAFYVFLASCLKEEKIGLPSFWRNLLTLLIWIAFIHLIKFAILFLVPAHIVLSITMAVISTLATIWFVALALATQKEAAENALLEEYGYAKEDYNDPEEDDLDAEDNHE